MCKKCLYSLMNIYYVSQRIYDEFSFIQNNKMSFLGKFPVLFSKASIEKLKIVKSFLELFARTKF